MAILGLDIGTTGTKATIFDNQGNMLSYAYGEYDIISQQSGYYEISPTTVWETAKDVIRAAYQSSGKIRIDAMSTSSLGEAYVMLDKAGKELANSPIYMDARGEYECDYLINTLGTDGIIDITGQPPHTMFSINKLMWQHKNNPELYKKTNKILFYGDYILHKLGGQYISDYSLASRTMCFDISKKCWSEKIIEAASLDIAIFPETKVAGSIIGEILPSVADELGINHGIKLVLGCQDQIMVAIGAGITKENQAANCIGTVDCITPLFKGAKLKEKKMKYLYASIPYIFEDTYVTYAFNMTGGSLLKWFRDTFAQKDKKIAQSDNKDIYSILDEEIPAEPTSIFVLPHFAGSPVPDPDIHAKGSIINLTLATKRGEIYKACMEGEAFEMKKNIETLEANGIKLDELRAVGGGSRSAQWQQIRADIFNRKISAMDYKEAGTLGTAILAGAAINYYPSVEKAADALNHIKTCYYPDRERNMHYSERYDKYKQLYELLKTVR